MAETVERIELETGPNVQRCVIWLHGLGADGHDFEPVVPALELPAGDGALGVRFVFPHAPTRPITINGGMVMRGWYDITGVDIGRKHDRQGIEDSAAIVQDLIAEQIDRGIASENIVLAGFSQGGAVVLHAGLRYPKALAGIMALSTYLPLPEHLMAERDEANSNVPIFMAHGLFDPVIALAVAENSHQVLQESGYDVDYRTYNMPHSVLPEELTDIGHWLKKVLRLEGR